MANYVVVWPQMALTVAGKEKILAKGDKVPSGVEETLIANLALVGALAVVAGAADPVEVVELDGPPAATAAKAKWLAYAVQQGANKDEAAKLTKEALVEQYGVAEPSGDEVPVGETAPAEGGSPEAS